MEEFLTIRSRMLYPNSMKTQDAIRFFGTKASLARALRITKQAVNGWGNTVPLGRAYQIEVLTNGRLTAPRPDGSTTDRAA